MIRTSQLAVLASVVFGAMTATSNAADEADQREMLRLTREAINLPSNEIERKIDLYTMAIKNYSGFYLPWTNRAVCYLNWGRWDKAIEDATTAIDLAPEQPHAWGVRGRAYAAKREFEKAYSDLDRALELAKTDIDLRNMHNDRGNVYFTAREYDKAIRDYKKAVSITPEFAKGWNNLGIAYRAKGDFNEAFANFDRAHIRDENAARILVNRGRVYVSLSDAVMAKEDFDKAVSLDPGDFSAYLHRAMFEYSRGEFEAAGDDVDTACERFPKSSYAAIWRFLIYSRLGREAEAKEQLEQLFRIRLVHDVWPMQVAQFLLKQINEQQVLSAAAQTDSEEQHKERLAEAYYFLSQYYLIQGDKKKCKENLAKSVAQNVPRVQELVMAKLELDGGWKEVPTPPPPKPVPPPDDIKLR